MPRFLLVVLRHDFRRHFWSRAGVAQQGQRGKRCAMPTMRRRRRVAIESGTCRSGRSGGASGSPTLGNCNLVDMPGGLRFRGGKGSPLGDQEAVGRDAHRRVVMEAQPSSTLEMAEPDFLLQVQIITLDT